MPIHSDANCWADAWKLDDDDSAQDVANVLTPLIRASARTAIILLSRPANTAHTALDVHAAFVAELKRLLGQSTDGNYVLVAQQVPFGPGETVRVVMNTGTIEFTFPARE